VIRAQAGDVNLTERGRIEVDCIYIIAEFQKHELCKVNMTILAFIGEKNPIKGQRSEAMISPNGKM